MRIRTSNRHSLGLSLGMQAAVVCAGLFSAASAMADTKSVTMKFSDPGNDTDKTVNITFTDTAKPDGDPNKVRVIPVTIPANTDAEGKEEAISAELTRKGVSNHRSLSGSGVTMDRVDTKVEVTFDNGGTMENDVMACAAPLGGNVHFSGHFDPFDPNRQPAIFTAGIVTDVGELNATISAAELNFQTDGPIICQALFQRLAPRAPQYGAQINYAGDRLEVYFDPAYTVTQGGIIWGTTSPSEGCGGSVLIEVPEMTLTVDPLYAGQPTTLRVSGADAQSQVSFYYSVRGTGDTFLGNLNVTLDLASPILAGTARADGSGNASLRRTVPGNARGVTAWLQAAAFEDLSNVVRTRVN